jgi:putative transposase
MPRRPRTATAGLVFHVMNRAARRLALFEQESDYALFIETLAEAHDRIPLRILSYVVMPNHWHLALWPDEDDQMPRFMAWLTGTHAHRWHLRRCSAGSGTIYQGRYKAIPVKDDYHFLVVCRYVERNPVKAGLVDDVADWPWSSVGTRARPIGPALGEWPVARPDDWVAYVNAPELPGEFRDLREAMRSGVPFGPPDWRDATASRLDWHRGLRPPGRPRLG